MSQFECLFIGQFLPIFRPGQGDSSNVSLTSYHSGSDDEDDENMEICVDDVKEEEVTLSLRQSVAEDACATDTSLCGGKQSF